MRIIIDLLPEWIRKRLRYLKYLKKRIQYYGNNRYCPVCEKKSSLFLQGGVIPRKDARCPLCKVAERHRFVWLFIKKKTNLFDLPPKKMLHVAPEEFFVGKFKKQFGNNYLTADLFNPKAMVKMDITDIKCPNQSFDIIYCSHVLEHIEDDKKAMGELFRVLKNDGWAILNVPIKGKKTIEDFSIVDPQKRLEAFGNPEHVRIYGSDYVERLHEVGFKVEVIEVKDLANSQEAIKMGLTSASGEIYYCTK